MKIKYLGLVDYLTTQNEMQRFVANLSTRKELRVAPRRYCRQIFQ